MSWDLVERVLSAFRSRDPDGRVRPAPEWRDLSPEERREAFEAAAIQRQLEVGLDPDGLSTTSRAVLARIEAGEVDRE